MQNVEQMLAMKKAETFVCSGFAPDVIHADRMAWDALMIVLGIDPVEKWTLKDMHHAFVPAKDETPVGVEFTAKFVRVPDEED